MNRNIFQDLYDTLLKHYVDGWPDGSAQRPLGCSSSRDAAYTEFTRFLYHGGFSETVSKLLEHQVRKSEGT